MCHDCGRRDSLPLGQGAAEKAMFWILLGCYVAYSGLKPTFREYLSAPNFKGQASWTGLIGDPETSISNSEDGRIQFNRGRSIGSNPRSCAISTLSIV
jgi:hypothetical protein